MKGLEKSKNLIETDNSMVMTREEWREVEGGKAGQMMMEGDLILCGEHRIQCIDDVL